MIEQVGIDIIQNRRIKLRPAFLKKVLSPEEQEIYASFLTKRRRQEFVAGRWAVKEAIIKTLATPVAMSQLNIGYLATDAPVLKNPAYEHILISISHERNYSVGMALRQTK